MAVQILADLYRGTWNAELFQVPDPTVDEAKISDILRKYREIVEQFRPSELEALGHIPAELLARMGENGFFGLSIPEAYGGAGLNTQEYLRVVEGIARLDLSVALVSLAHLSIGVKGLVLFGSDEQRTKYLPRGASGETIFAYALTEPLIGSDAKHITTRAELTDDGRTYVLNGQKTYIRRSADQDQFPCWKIQVFMFRLKFTATVVQQRAPQVESDQEKQNTFQQRTLWLQVAIRDQVLTVKTAKGDDNVADLMTKHLASPRIFKLLSSLGFHRRDGSHELALKAS